MSRFACGILTILAATAVAAGYSTSRAAEPAGQVSAKAPDADPFRVPDGTVAELQKYLEGLKNLPPPSTLRPAGAEFRRKRAAAQLAASEKILAVKPTPPSDVVRMALRAKVVALTTLERLGDATAAPKIEATVDQARQLVPPPPAPPPGVPPILPPPTRDPQADHDHASMVPGMVPAPGVPPPAPQGPPQLVLDVQFAILEGRAQGAAAMNGKQFDQLVNRLVEFLKQGPIDSDGARLSVDLGMAAEEHQTRERASATYTTLGKILAGSNDEKVRSTSATLLGAARRLDLAGKPFVLQGATLGGRTIDLKKYKGKIVLIDFFATWCGPCRDEIPNIAKCYRAYRKRGFEVIGVSLDRDRKTIADFLDKEKYPWPVLLDHYEARGTDKSMATYYGLFTIPQMILVGKDGRVLSIDVRGQRLNKALAEQLGSAAAGGAN